MNPRTIQTKTQDEINNPAGLPAETKKQSASQPIETKKKKKKKKRASLLQMMSKSPEQDFLEELNPSLKKQPSDDGAGKPKSSTLTKEQIDALIRKFKLSKSYFDKESFSVAEVSFQDVITLCYSDTNTPEVVFYKSMALYYLGFIAVAKDNINSAINYYIDAKKYLTGNTAGNIRDEHFPIPSAYYQKLAEISEFIAQQTLAKATTKSAILEGIKLWEDAIKYYKNCTDEVGIVYACRALNEVGIAYSSIGEYGAANIRLEEAINKMLQQSTTSTLAKVDLESLMVYTSVLLNSAFCRFKMILAKTDNSNIELAIARLLNAKLDDKGKAKSNHVKIAIDRLLEAKANLAVIREELEKLKSLPRLTQDAYFDTFTQLCININFGLSICISTYVALCNESHKLISTFLTEKGTNPTDIILGYLFNYDLTDTSTSPNALLLTAEKSISDALQIMNGIPYKVFKHTIVSDLITDPSIFRYIPAKLLSPILARYTAEQLIPAPITIIIPEEKEYKGGPAPSPVDISSARLLSRSPFASPSSYSPAMFRTLLSPTMQRRTSACGFGVEAPQLGRSLSYGSSDSHR